MPKTNKLISYTSISLGLLLILAQFLPVVHCFGDMGRKSLEFAHVSECGAPDHSHNGMEMENDVSLFGSASDHTHDCMTCVDIPYFSSLIAYQAFSKSKVSPVQSHALSGGQSIAVIPSETSRQRPSGAGPPEGGSIQPGLQASVLLL